MPRARDLLNRFRPSGTPGAAGVAGVPTDHEAGPSEELAPLFAALAATERECRAVVDRAAADAQRIREDAEAEAVRLVAAARDGQPEERAAVVARLREHGTVEARAITEEAERRAAEVRAVAAARTAACVDDVVDAVRTMLAQPTGPDPRDAP